MNNYNQKWFLCPECNQVMPQFSTEHKQGFCTCKGNEVEMELYNESHSKIQKNENYNEIVRIRKRGLKVLEECINELENMSEEEFNRIKKERGIGKKIYETSKYIDDDFEIIF